MKNNSTSQHGFALLLLIGIVFGGCRHLDVEDLSNDPKYAALISDNCEFTIDCQIVTSNGNRFLINRVLEANEQSILEVKAGSKLVVKKIIREHINYMAEGTRTLAQCFILGIDNQPVPFEFQIVGNNVPWRVSK
ncbi:MAG: hypothetical protein AB7F75_07010 [Planctomycetota bacterium]